jgi:predicted outer membrane repeat protein
MALASVPCLSLDAHAAVTHVPGDQPTIQQGILATAPGDTVLVAPGTYTGPLNRDLDLGGAAIAVLSEAGPAATIIDCEGAGRGFHVHSGEDHSSVIAGFTIRHGLAVEGGGILIFDASPTIGDCILTDNEASNLGGGLAIISTFATYPGGVDPLIEDCVLDANVAQGTLGGGGMAVYSTAGEYLGRPIVERCTISSNSPNGLLVVQMHPNGVFRDCEIVENIGRGISIQHNTEPHFEGCLISANTGGGVVVGTGWAGGTFTDCTISDHTTSESGAGVRDQSYEGSQSFTGCRFANNHAMGQGGGLYIISEGGATFDDCEFEGNSATHGGAFLYYDPYQHAPFDLSGCRFIDNSATQWGGAALIRVEYQAAAIHDCVFLRNTAGQRGGALYIEGENQDLQIASCTLAANEAPAGAGVYAIADFPPFYIDVEITNTILAFSPLGESSFCDGDVAIVDVTCSDVFGNQGGDWVGCLAPWVGVNGNIAADPQFCDLVGGDLAIAETSPCAPAHSGGCGLIGAVPAGCSSTGIDPGEVAPALQARFSVSPNPVIDGARFHVDPATRPWSIEIYDPLGRLVDRLDPNGSLEWRPGQRAVRGIYFARLESERGTSVAQFVVLR